MTRRPNAVEALTEGFWIAGYLFFVGCVLGALYLVVTDFVLPNVREVGLVVGGLVGAVVLFYVLGYLKLVVPQKIKQWNTRSGGDNG